MIQLFLSSRQNAETNSYRDWAAEEAAKFSAFLSLWRFESEPAFAELETLYLRGVAESQGVLFIAASDTSDATAAELSHAVDQGKDILALLLAVPSRQARLSDLISRIRERSATKTVEVDEASFRAAVRDAISEWLLFRFAGGATEDRGDRLRTMLASSRLRTQQLWMAAGVSQEQAVVFASDDRVGDPVGFVALDESEAFQILVGPKGSGKTLTLERLFQKAVRSAQSEVLAPIPVFLRASEVVQSLQNTVEAVGVGLGSLIFNGVALYLDGLDEVDESKAERLMQDAAVVAQALPRSRVLIAGRIEPPIYLKQFVVRQPELSREMMRSLMQNVGGECAARMLRALPNEAVGISVTLLRPLFAIVLATTDGEEIGNLSEEQIVDRLIRAALSRSERTAVATDLLQRLAARTLDEETGKVSSDEFSAQEQSDLLSTRLVVEEEGFLRIPIHVAAERAASLWLMTQDHATVLVRCSSAWLADRWRTPVLQYIRRLPDSEAEALVLEIAHRDLIFAIRLAEADSQPHSAWSASSAQHSLEAAAQVISRAMPRLFDREPVKFFAETDAIRIEQFDVTGRLLANTTYYGGLTKTRHAALLFVRNHVVKLVDHALERRSLTVENAVIAEEEIWNLCRLMLSGLGSLFQGGIDVAQLTNRLETLPVGNFLVMGDGARTFKVDGVAVRSKLEELVQKGQQHYFPPFVVGDRPPDKWVWSVYSVDRLLERRRASVEQAMDGYQELVSTWFPGLANAMRKSLLMPAVYREHIKYDGVNSPVYFEYWTPLRENDTNRTDVERGDDFDFLTISKEMRHLVDERRFESRNRISIKASTGFLRMWTPWPVRDLAYSWLLADLKEIGFAKSMQLPFSD